MDRYCSKVRKINGFSLVEMQEIRNDLLAAQECNVGNISEERIERMKLFDGIPPKISITPNKHINHVSYQNGILSVVDFDHRVSLTIQIDETNLGISLLPCNPFCRKYTIESKPVSSGIQLSLSFNDDQVVYEVAVLESTIEYMVNVDGISYSYDSQGNLDSIICNNFVYLPLHDSIDPRLKRDFFLTNAANILE